MGHKSIHKKSYKIKLLSPLVLIAALFSSTIKSAVQTESRGWGKQALVSGAVLAGAGLLTLWYTSHKSSSKLVSEKDDADKVADFILLNRDIGEGRNDFIDDEKVRQTISTADHTAITKILKPIANPSVITAAMMRASGENNLEIIESLLKLGSSPNQKIGLDGRDSLSAPILSIALKNQRIDIAEAILRAKANIYELDTHGAGPLDYAIRYQKNKTQLLQDIQLLMDFRIEGHTYLNNSIRYLKLYGRKGKQYFYQPGKPEYYDALLKIDTDYSLVDSDIKEYPYFQEKMNEYKQQHREVLGTALEGHFNEPGLTRIVTEYLGINE